MPPQEAGRERSGKGTTDGDGGEEYEVLAHLKI